MLKILALLAQAAPFVELDGPETFQFGFDIAAVIALTTLFVKAWEQGQKNKRINDFVSWVSPLKTSRAVEIATGIDDLAKQWKSGEVPIERLQARAEDLSAKAKEILS